MSSSSSPPSSRAVAIFRKHASGQLDGEPHMTTDDFVAAIAPPNEDYHKIARESYAVLFSAADRSQKGLVSIQDWIYFENLLKKPDAEYQIAFRLFDTDGNGVVDYDEFIRYYNQNKSDNSFPFDWNAPWASLYCGNKNRRHAMTYDQFAQMLRGLQGERVRQVHPLSLFLPFSITPPSLNFSELLI
ncbi:hypothetical protein BZA70DRAFT_132093 [Myxozyma melibiosi]|uniref:EF-hand domain-containing protein n=1 Tax=Myxozyma melibiosi TaxID=54550 RepID=A0ABR1F8Z4_9ASCO